MVLQEDLCAKSWKHLCKHMAFFQPCRQCSHSLKIDVRGNIPCPGAMLGMTLNIWKALCFEQYPLSMLQRDGVAERNPACGFYRTLCFSADQLYQLLLFLLFCSKCWKYLIYIGCIRSVIKCSVLYVDTNEMERGTMHTSHCHRTQYWRRSERAVMSLAGWLVLYR